MGYFVFEAKHMSFNNLTEALAEPAYAILSGKGNTDKKKIAESYSLYDRCLLVAVWSVLEQRYKDSEDKTEKEERRLRDVDIALKIVKQLDELDEAAGRSSDAREAHQRSGDTEESEWTAEDILMNELLQERFGEDFLGAHLGEPVGEGETEEGAIDIAMCFDEEGNSIGLGTSHVFGTHGYHR